MRGQHVSRFAGQRAQTDRLVNLVFGQVAIFQILVHELFGSFGSSTTGALLGLTQFNEQFTVPTGTTTSDLTFVATSTSALIDLVSLTAIELCETPAGDGQAITPSFTG